MRDSTGSWMASDHARASTILDELERSLRERKSGSLAGSAGASGSGGGSRPSSSLHRLSARASGANQLSIGTAPRSPTLAGASAWVTQLSSLESKRSSRSSFGSSAQPSPQLASFPRLASSPPALNHKQSAASLLSVGTRTGGGSGGNSSASSSNPRRASSSLRGTPSMPPSPSSPHAPLHPPPAEALPHLPAPSSASKRSSSKLSTRRLSDRSNTPSEVDPSSPPQPQRSLPPLDKPASSPLYREAFVSPVSSASPRQATFPGQPLLVVESVEDGMAIVMKDGSVDAEEEWLANAVKSEGAGGSSDGARSDEEASSDFLHSAPKDMIHFALKQGLLAPGEIRAVSPNRTPRLNSSARMGGEQEEEEEEKRRLSLMRRSIGSLMSAVESDLIAQIPEEREEEVEAREQGPGPDSYWTTPAASKPVVAGHSRDPSLSVGTNGHEGHTVGSVLSSSSSPSHGYHHGANLESISSIYSTASAVTSSSTFHLPQTNEEEVSSDDSVDTAKGDAPSDNKKKKRRLKKFDYDNQRVQPPTPRRSKDHPPPVPPKTPTADDDEAPEIEEFKYYEFSPDLPPFAAGLKPKDLTGAGTWAGLVARAGSETAWQAQAQRDSLMSNEPRGPVSMRQVAAEARWRQEQAKLEKQRQMTMLSTMSLSPVDVLRHAKSHASMNSSAAGSIYSAEFASSRGSLSTLRGSPSLYSLSVLQEPSETHSVSTGVGDGIAHGAGAAGSVKAPKVYAEVNMQTSPVSTPPGSPPSAPAPMARSSRSKASGLNSTLCFRPRASRSTTAPTQRIRMRRKGRSSIAKRRKRTRGR